MHDGTFGPGLSGKTTLAQARSLAYFRATGRKSIVFDPNVDAWGPHAYVTNSRGTFLDSVWKSRSCEIWAEEAAVTIARDRDLMELFTRIRHNGHRLHVIGHSGSDLLPGMRQQLTRLFLFRQPRSAAEVWAELFAEEKILAACELAQFDFLDCELYRAPVRRRLALPA